MSSTTLTTEMLDFLFKQAFSSHHGDQLLNLVDTRCSDELIHNFYRHKTAPTWVDFQKVKTQNDKPLQISFETGDNLSKCLRKELFAECSSESEKQNCSSPTNSRFSIMNSIAAAEYAEMLNDNMKDVEIQTSSDIDYSNYEIGNRESATTFITNQFNVFPIYENFHPISSSMQPDPVNDSLKLNISSDYSSTSDVKSCGTNSFLDDDGPIQTLLAEWNEFISETNEETSKQLKTDKMELLECEIDSKIVTKLSPISEKDDNIPSMRSCNDKNFGTYVPFGVGSLNVEKYLDNSNVSIDAAGNQRSVCKEIDEFERELADPPSILSLHSAFSHLSISADDVTTLNKTDNTAYLTGRSLTPADGDTSFATFDGSETIRSPTEPHLSFSTPGVSPSKTFRPIFQNYLNSDAMSSSSNVKYRENRSSELRRSKVQSDFNNPRLNTSLDSTFLNKNFSMRSPSPIFHRQMSESQIFGCRSSSPMSQSTPKTENKKWPKPQIKILSGSRLKKIGSAVKQDMPQKSDKYCSGGISSLKSSENSEITCSTKTKSSGCETFAKNLRGNLLKPQIAVRKP